MQPVHELRTTRQRKIILDELRKSESHPTADEMYEMVRRRLPRISLGTVYRNLEVLSDCGMIRKLEIGGTQKRFDGIAGAHYHLLCTRCGRIEDLPTESVPEFKKALERRKFRDFEIREYRVALLGLCPKCRSGKKRLAAVSRGAAKGGM